ncbi:MAG: redoxin domain-containing protein [Armatimonadota bacterium]|nr:redoxin domain-containing protein [Armatimonadota bacterium]
MMKLLASMTLLVSFLSFIGGAPVGGSVQSLTLRSIDGLPVRPLEMGAHKGVLLFFIAHDCPICNTYAPEINRICREYTPRGIAPYIVYIEPDLTPAAARTHARAYGYTCAAILDPAHRLVRKADATVTPEAALFGRDGKLCYRGRIDDLFVSLGQQRYAVRRHDLRLALDAFLQHQTITEPFTTAIGCFIPH